MIRSKHITTTVFAASSLAAAMSAPAVAHHIPGHAALAAVEQDIKAASDEAKRQVSSAQKAIENTGSHTRQLVVETAETEVRSAARRVSRVRWSAEKQVEEVRKSAETRVKPVVAYGQGRVQHTSAAGQQRASQVRGAAERRAERAKRSAEGLSASAQRRVAALAYRISREVEAIVENGSMRVSTSGGEYSFGWTRSGGCWTGRLSTPLTPPNSRLKRRTGASVEPVKGQRTGAETSQGDVSASTGC